MVEFVIGELPDLSTAGAHCSEPGQRHRAVVVGDVQRVLGAVWWGAGEHGQNTRKDKNATYGATNRANITVRMWNLRLDIAALHQGGFDGDNLGQSVLTVKDYLSLSQK